MLITPRFHLSFNTHRDISASKLLIDILQVLHGQRYEFNYERKLPVRVESKLLKHDDEFHCCLPFLVILGM